LFVFSTLHFQFRRNSAPKNAQNSALIAVGFVKIGIIKAILRSVSLFMLLLPTLVKFVDLQLLTSYKFFPTFFRFPTFQYFFNVHGSVHCNNILVYKSQQDAHVTEFIFV